LSPSGCRYISRQESGVLCGSIIAITFNILNLLGVSPYIQEVVSGIIIIVAVLIGVRRLKII